MKHKVKHIHFVGVGGSGMSGIAEVLVHLDYTVTGSDLAASATTRRLEGEGIKVMLGHNAENIAGADAVVISTAVKGDNPEVIAARERHIPVVPRAQMLAELMRLKHTASPSPVRMARPPPPAWLPASWPRAALIRPSSLAGV
jgi:UDP-N-acetylmuramate--alanine ligase